MIARNSALLSCLFLAACGSGSGTVAVSLTDAPLDGVTAVNVAVASVEVHSTGGGAQGGWVTVMDTEKSFNLLDLRNGVTAELGDAQLPVGDITQIRLILSKTTAPTLVDSSGTYPLKVPSGTETGIKLIGCFKVVENQTTTLTLDFDAAASVVTTGTGSYQLQPTIHIVESNTCADAADKQQP